MIDLAAFGDGLVAVGEKPFGGSVAWLSDDAAAWSLPFDIGSGTVKSVLAWDDGLIAVGWDSSPPRTSPRQTATTSVEDFVARTGDLFGAVWATSDGRAWNRSAVVYEAISLNAVTAFRDVLVAVGVTEPQSGTGLGNGIIVTSEDGVVWTTVFRGLGPFRDVVMFQDEVIAVGMHAVLASPDGVEWREVSGWESSEEVTELLAATVWQDQLLLSGRVENPCGCVLVLSADTKTWLTAAPGP